jgi:hypothetical protein
MNDPLSRDIGSENRVLVGDALTHPSRSHLIPFFGS